MKPEFDIEIFIFSHLQGKLMNQGGYLTTLRNQAGVAAAASGLIATFFGGMVGEGALSGVWTLSNSNAILLLFALSMFSGSIFFSVLVLTDYDEITTSFDTKKMLKKYSEMNSEAFFESYVSDGEWYFADNEKKIGVAQNHLRWGMLLVFLQIIPWLIVVGGTVDG